MSSGTGSPVRPIAAAEDSSSSFFSLHFFVLIPIGQKQLDPDAIWISAIFLFTFPPGVLAAYVAQFLLLLKTLPIEFHVQGLDNVTNISTLVALAPNLQEELLSGFLPSWLNLIFCMILVAFIRNGTPRLFAIGK